MHGMTIRIAMLIFVLSFAAITGWLVTREPADTNIAQTPPVPKATENDIKDAANTDIRKPHTDVVAITGEDQDLKKALESVTIPRIDIQDEALSEALAFLNLRIMELESTRFSSLNFVVRRPSVSDANAVSHPAPDSLRVTFTATDISVADAITRICEQTGFQWSIEDNMLVLNPQQ
jgi:hypothetical protein